jgi:N-acetylglucosaminyl-diphospho-decaprenol L-rhamnosyltransferase
MIQSVVLSFNHPVFTSRCLRSVAQAAPAGGLPPLLVHNGSEGKHVAFLRGEFPKVLHLELARNGGYAGGVNHGLRAAFERAPWALLITNDCQLMQWPNVPTAPGLYGATLLRKDQQTVEAVGGVFDAVRGRLHHFKSQDAFAACLAKTGPFYPYIPGHSFLLHHSIFERYGGFDETLFMYWEDVDLSVRYHYNRVPLRVLDDLRLSHDGGKTCRKDRKYSAFYFQRNRGILLRRYSPRPLYSKTLWTREMLRRGLTCFWRKDWEGLKHTQRALSEAGSI